MGEELQLVEKENKKSRRKTHRKSRVKEENSSFSAVVENTSLVKVEEQPLEVVEEKPIITIGSSKDEIVGRVQQTSSIDELKDLTNLFGLSLTKAEIVRASKESDLMDKLLELAEKRVVEKGDYMPNAEILDFMRTLQGNVDKSRKTFNDDIDKASTNIVNAHTEINVNVNGDMSSLSRESKEKIIERMKMIFDKINQEQQDVVLEEPQEIEIKEESEKDD